MFPIFLVMYRSIFLFSFFAVTKPGYLDHSKSAEKFVSFDQINYKRVNLEADTYKERRIGSTATEIDDRLSPGNVTLLSGETALLACKIYNLGNKSVSWLRHTSPIPQLMALNNMSNSLDSRVKAMVGEEWSEFVLMIRDASPGDSGDYECQVSGPNHTTSSKMIHLNVIATTTTIDAGPDIYVSIGSKLVLTCRVYTAGIKLNYLIWRRGDKIAKFIGGENSGVKLEPDGRGTFVTSLDVGTIGEESDDKYECSPGPGNTAVARVHVSREDTMLTVQNSCGILQNLHIIFTFSAILVLAQL